MNLHRIPTTIEHVNQLADTMREYDKKEARLLGRHPAVALAYSVFSATKSFTYLNDNGNVICIVGVSHDPQYPSFGIPWMIATEEAFSNNARFLRENSKLLPELEEGWSTLINVIHADNIKAIKWLRWLGFEFTPNPKHPEFLTFHKEVKHV